MTLSRLAREFAAEISNHDWSDAPFRADRAGHRHSDDFRSRTPQLDHRESESVRLNVIWVTAQVLAFSDPNLDPVEYAEACGLDTQEPSDRSHREVITAGLRVEHETGDYDVPGGTPVWDEDPTPIDRHPDQVGTREEWIRTLWPNPITPAFVTARSRNVHRTTLCAKYLEAERIAHRKHRAAPEPVKTTTGEAREAGKGICVTCWAG